MACEENVEANESPSEFTGRISCKRGSGPSGFPSLVVSGRENNGNASEVVITFASVVSKDMISIDDLVEYVSFEPCFLDKVDIEVFCFHHGDDVFVACVVV
jgi:hypothetical protein